jgi:hypothetical protein
LSDVNTDAKQALNILAISAGFVAVGLGDCSIWWVELDAIGIEMQSGMMHVFYYCYKHKITF